MQREQKDGSSKFAHLKQVKLATGKKTREILEYEKKINKVKDLDIWSFFWEIRSGLSVDDSLSFTEIKNAFDLLEEDRTFFKVRLIKTMNNAFLKGINK